MVYPEPIATSVKVKNYWVGTVIYFAIALLAAIIMPIYVKYNTNDKTQIATNMR